MTEQENQEAAPRRGVASAQVNIAGSAGGRVFAVQSGTQNIHSNRSDVPYRVEPYRLDSSELRLKSEIQSPSALLSSRLQVVPFIGRSNELSLLAEWRDNPAHPLGFMLVHGPGGQGKTRLAAEFSRLSEQAGWNIATARHDSEMAPKIDAAEMARDRHGVLIIVDYAEQWPERDIVQLAHDLKDRDPAQIRVVLLARARDWWWPMLATELAKAGFSSNEMALGPLAVTLQERTAAFVTAKDSFAATLGVANADQIPDPDMTDNVWSQALVIHMAALVAVYSVRENQDLPAKPSDLASYLLSRERDSWQAAYANKRREEALAAVRESVDSYRQLATADPAYEPNLASTLNNLAIQLTIHGRREEALAAVNESVNSYRRLATVDPAAYEPNLASALNNLSNRLSEQGQRQAAVEVSREAVRILRSLVATSPTEFASDLSTALNNLGTRLAEAGEHEEAFNVATEAVAAYRRLSNSPAVETGLASALNNLGVRLAELGRHDQALLVAREATEVRRKLANENPDAWLPDLAGSLNNLGIRLADIGRHEEALAATTEAVDVYRRLADVNPDAWLPDLAKGLRGFAWVRAVASGDDLDEALNAVEESIEIYNGLVRTQSSTFLEERRQARELARRITGRLG